MSISRLFHRISTIVLIAVLLVGCSGASGSFDRAAMLANIAHNIIVPAHATLVREATALETVTRAFQDNPSAESLAGVQAQWQQTSDAWHSVELFGFNEVMPLHNQISKWPTKEVFIEAFIADPTVATLDAAFIESIGSTAKGLPAIEYLIFAPEGGDSAALQRFTDGEAGERRLAYLVALAANLYGKTDELLNLWAAEGENFVEQFSTADLDGGEMNSSISMLTNEMIGLLENAVQTKLGKPLGKRSYGEPIPHQAEAWRSGASTAALISNVASFQRTFNGGNASSEYLGLDDYLDYLDARAIDGSLAAQINAQTDAALAALEAIPAPLHIAVESDPEAVEQAYSELRDLLVLVKANMANNLGVTVTFNDNDGD